MASTKSKRTRIARPASIVGLAWRGMRECQSVPIGITGLVGAVLAAAFSAGTVTMPLWLVLVIASVVIFTMSILIGMVVIAWTSNYDLLPRVLQVVKSFPPFDTAVAMLVVEDSHMLSNDMPISVYQLVGDVEQLVGMGKVVHQQQTGEFQIAVAVRVGDSDWNNHISNERGDALVIKPSIPSSYMPAVPLTSTN